MAKPVYCVNCGAEIGGVGCDPYDDATYCERCGKRPLCPRCMSTHLCCDDWDDWEDWDDERDWDST